MAKLPELTKIYISAYSDQAIQLGEAVPGFAGVEQLEDGGQYSCVVKNGVQTEKFIGTFSAASQSLTRETQNVYPAGTDKISLAADNLFVDFVMLGRDLPNDDSLRATLQSNQGASFVQSSNGSIENRLNTLDTEINDKISGSEGAVTGDGLVQGIVFSGGDQTLKATYRDNQGTHIAIVGKTPVVDSLGDSSTSAISQRAATVAINDRLSGTIYANSATDDGNGIGLHWQGDGGKAQEGLPNFQYYKMSDATKAPVFVNLITRTYFEKYTNEFVSGKFAALISQNDGYGLGLHFNQLLGCPKFDYQPSVSGDETFDLIISGKKIADDGLNISKIYGKSDKSIFARTVNESGEFTDSQLVTTDNIPAPDLSGYVSGTATNDGQITALTQDTATSRPKVTLSDKSTEILALQSDIPNIDTSGFVKTSSFSLNNTSYSSVKSLVIDNGADTPAIIMPDNSIITVPTSTTLNKFIRTGSDANSAYMTIPSPYSSLFGFSWEMVRMGSVKNIFLYGTLTLKNVTSASVNGYFTHPTTNGSALISDRIDPVAVPQFYNTRIVGISGSVPVGINAGTKYEGNGVIGTTATINFGTAPNSDVTIYLNLRCELLYAK